MRKLVVALVFVLVLFGLGAFAISNFNTYLENNREWLADRISTVVGRPVTFEEVGVSFRGGLGARVGGLSIGDDADYSKQPFLQVGRADVVVKILPALTGSYEVDRVVLDAPRVNVIRTKAGFNFDSIGKGGEAKPGGETAPAAGGAEKSGADALPLLVSLLDIRGGRVSFVDRTASPASELLIEQLDFSASDLGFDDPIAIDLAMAVLGFPEQNVKVSGSVGPVGSPEAAARAPLDLEVAVGPIVVDRLKQLPVVGKSVPPELSSPDPMVVDVEVAGRADAPSVRVGFDASDASLRYGSVFNKPKGTRFAVEADVAQAGDRIDVGNLVLRLAEATLTGAGSVGTGKSTPIDFNIKGAAVPLDGWGRFFAAAEGLDVDGTLDIDVAAKGAMASGLPVLNGTLGLQGVRAVQPGGGIEVSGLTTTVKLLGDRVEVPPTRLEIGGEPVDISATVTSVKNMAAEVALKAPKLRLAALGAAGEGVANDESLEDLEVKATVQSASSGPQARASVRSSRGSLRDVEYSNLNAEVGLANQKVNLKKLSVKTFQGLVTGGGSYDMAAADNPAFDFRGRLNNLDVAAIVDYLGLGSTFNMTGRVNGDLVLDGAGVETQQILETLTGNGSLNVDDGILKGVNLAEQALSSITGVPGLSSLIPQKTRRKYPDLFSQSDTVFEKLGGAMKISDGKMNLEDLALAAKDYRMKGAGKIGFDRSVAIASTLIASADLSQDLLGNVREAKYLLDSNGRFELPLVISGELPDVGVRPDTEYVSKKLSSALVSEGIDKGLDALFGSKGNKSKKSADGKSAAADAPVGDGGEEEKPEDAAEQLIRKGLEGLLGGGR